MAGRALLEVSSSRWPWDCASSEMRLRRNCGVAEDGREFFLPSVVSMTHSLTPKGLGPQAHFGRLFVELAVLDEQAEGLPFEEALVGAS